MDYFDELALDNDDRPIDPLWSIHSSYTVEQAAALLAGYEPGRVELCRHDTNFEQRFSRFGPAKSALTNAINDRDLQATIRRRARIAGWDEYPNIGESLRKRFEDDDEVSQFPEVVIYCETPDWSQTTVRRKDLIAWLAARGYKTGFFFPDTTDAPDYLDPGHPRYAPKLAASVRAWEAVTEDGGKHPKQALTIWLNKHASEFGLTDNDGLPIKLSIEDCAKVANWKPGGGAPTTPGE